MNVWGRGEAIRAPVTPRDARKGFQPHTPISQNHRNSDANINKGKDVKLSSSQFKSSLAAAFLSVIDDGNRLRPASSKLYICPATSNTVGAVLGLMFELSRQGLCANRLVGVGRDCTIYISTHRERACRRGCVGVACVRNTCNRE